MKKNIFYLFAHQDDEFGVFIDLYKKINDYNIYIFYLTSGYKKKISASKLLERDKESINVLKKIGVKKNNINFFGRKLGIRCNKLYLNADRVYKEIINFSKKKTPHQIVTLAWEGGHEDHDACNLIARKVGYKFDIIKKSGEFSVYNAYKSNFIYFKVFNPIKKSGNYIRINITKRLFLIKLLFYYKTQIKIWVGLYPFIIFHYIFLGYNFIQPLNNEKVIKKPHSGKLLYEKRKFCQFQYFKKKLINFFND